MADPTLGAYNIEDLRARARSVHRARRRTAATATPRVSADGVTLRLRPALRAAPFSLVPRDFDAGGDVRPAVRVDRAPDPLEEGAGLTGDFSQVHTDEEFCKKTEFGTRIAHGLLGLSIAQGLSWRTGYTQGTGVASLGWNNWNFKKPIKIGDTVHVRWHVTEKRESRSKPTMGIITEWVDLMNQHDDVVQSGEHITMIRKRPVD